MSQYEVGTYSSNGLKAIVHPPKKNKKKPNIFSSFTHPYFIPNLYDYSEHKISYFENVNGVLYLNEDRMFIFG